MSAKKEYRWEYKEIGQGHYYTDIQMCIDEASKASLHRPDLRVNIEMFKPERFLIATMGPTEKRQKMFVLECDGELDGDPFKAESLQEAQAKILAKNGNVVKETYILCAKK